MKAPCTRIGLLAPIGENNISPLPNSFSAPAISRIVRESIWDPTAKEIRLGTFALIEPVITLTDGRCVANTI